MGDHGPTHGGVDTGNQKSQSHDRVDESLSGDAGAFHQPGDGQTEKQREKSRGDSKEQRIGDHPVDERITDDFVVVGKV